MSHSNHIDKEEEPSNVYKCRINGGLKILSIIITDCHIVVDKQDKTRMMELMM